MDEQIDNPRYVAGWNMPGYLPEVDPEQFETFNEAIQYLADTIERFWDADAEMGSVIHADDEEFDADGVWLALHSDIHTAPISGPADDGTANWSGSTGDGRTVFWVRPISERDR